MNWEDLLIDLPVLGYLRLNRKTLLEANIQLLDRTDYRLTDQKPSNMGNLGWLMTAHLNRQREDDMRSAVDRLRVNYHKARSKEDPFLNPSLLDFIDEDQQNDICKAVSFVGKTAKRNGLADTCESNLMDILRDHMKILRTLFSAGPPAKLLPLNIELTPDATPVEVRLHRNSQDK